MALAAAVARRHRAEIARAIERDLKSKDRARLAAARDRVRALRRERRAAIASALGTCARRRALPTGAQVLRELRAEKAKAKSACDAAKVSARALSQPIARARAERDAEAAYQRDMRRIARLQRGRERAARKSRGPSIARASRDETDEEVRGNIPPELVALFNRVRRQIRGSERMSRTEAFLHYAEEHPDEQWDALESRIDAEIAEMERRQAMPNPKKKRNRPKGKPAKARKGKRGARKNPCNPSPAFAHVKKQLERSRAESRTLRRKLKERKKNPRRPPARWWDRCLASVAGQKYARDPAAICGAAWWKKPPRERARIVRQLERGTPKQRRFAVGIAKAERNRADRARPPPRRDNPAMTDAEAAAEYERTHWGERGPRPGAVRKGAANPAYGTATKLGTLVAVTYRTRKGGDREATDYEHLFEGPRPTLAYNDGGLLIAGGKYVIKGGGIDG